MDPDPRARRRQITEAFWRIAIRGGLGSATFREVAAEAAVSVGLVQHYFKNRQELLLGSLNELLEAVTARLTARIASLGPNPTERAVVGAVLEEFLPLDRKRRDVAVLFIAFHTASLTDADLASAPGMDFPAAIAGFLREQLEQAMSAGGLQPSVDPDLAAKATLTLIIGLGHLVPNGTYTHNDARKLVAYTLDQLFS